MNDGTLAPQPKVELTLAAQKRFDDLLVDMVVECSMPFAMVSHNGFQKFVAGLRPGYVLPSRGKFNGLLKDRYDVAIEILKTNCRAQKYMHYTTDLWKSVCH